MNSSTDTYPVAKHAQENTYRPAQAWSCCACREKRSAEKGSGNPDADTGADTSQAQGTAPDNEAQGTAPDYGITPDNGTDTDNHTDAGTGTDTGTDTGTGSVVDTNPDADAGAGNSTDTEADTNTGTDTDTVSGTDTGTAPEADRETVPGSGEKSKAEKHGLLWLIRALYRDTRIRFLFVGALNTVIGLVTDSLVCYLFQRYTSVPSGIYLVAGSVSGTLLGAINSYFWNKYFTFKSRKKSLAEVVRFALVYIVCFLFSYFAQLACLKVFGYEEESIYFYIAKVCVLVVQVLLSWFGQRYFCFRKEKPKAQAQEGASMESACKEGVRKKDACKEDASNGENVQAEPDPGQTDGAGAQTEHGTGSAETDTEAHADTETDTETHTATDMDTNTGEGTDRHAGTQYPDTRRDT